MWKEAKIELIDPEDATAAEHRSLGPDTDAIDDGIEKLKEMINWRLDYDSHDGDPDQLLEWESRCSVPLNALDKLTETIGLDVSGVFRRWDTVPVTLMPAHVSNRYGASDKGSLLRLLDDAVRAYVFGAPAASIAMCRAALEMVLKRHYGHGQWENAKLGNLVFLASEQYDFIEKASLDPLVKKANRILHNYGQIERLDEEEERTILLFLGALKSLIERAPKP